MAKNKKVEVKEEAHDEVTELTNLERARLMASESAAVDAARVAPGPVFDAELGELV